MKNITVRLVTGLGIGGLIFGGWLQANAAPGIPSSIDRTLKVPAASDLKISETMASLTTRLEKLEANNVALKKQISDLEAAHAKHTHTLPVEFLPPKVVFNSPKPIVTPYIFAAQTKSFKTNPPAK